MKDIFYYILKLPKELQDLISEYNVEHRPMFTTVLQQLHLRNNYICDNCQNLKTKTDVIIKCILFQKYRFCSEYCSYEHRFGILNSFKKKLFKKKYKMRVLNV